jgi:LemA protein
MSSVVLLGLVLVAVAALPLLSLMFVYNRLAVLSRRCERALADIDVQVRHRHDLIPSLVEAVRGFADHEQGIIDSVVNARAEALRAVGSQDKLQAETMLTSSIVKLLSVAESNPSIQAGGHFSELRGEIIDVNNKIAAARRFFNMAVSEFNASLDQFPANIVGRRFGLSAKKSYDLGLERLFVEEVPVVKF